ncbi:MAG: tetratricopeptide repeat protein, partial [Pseudomonadota bacterium]
KLKNDPTNLDQWYMLGKSYQFLQRYEDAIATYEHLLKNGGDQNPDVYTNLADAVAMASGRVLTQRSKDLLDKALQLDPKHTKALWLAGTAAYQDKELKKALGYWLRLEPLFADKPQEQEQIRGNILETKSALGMDITADQRRWEMAQSGSGGGDDASATPTTAAGASIQGRIQLDAAVAKRAQADDTVFIFARAAEGPPMPLAVLRKRVKDLPMDFVLDDSMAMSPAMRLSSFPRVIVTARVSKSGNATAQSGDLQATAATVDVGSKRAVQLVINSVVP